jgi:hypothetical protein
MRKPLDQVGPRFVSMAHSIGMAVAATSDAGGRPRTRVMQPVWEWDGAALTGWVTTTTNSSKVDDLRRTPHLSFTYWEPDQDTCGAECEVEFLTGDDERAAAWHRFASTPPPAGFDPAIHPDWDSPASPTFGVLRLRPYRLRVMPGTLMTKGEGELWTWRRVP